MGKEVRGREKGRGQRQMWIEDKSAWGHGLVFPFA